MDKEANINLARNLLRLTFGLLPIITGLDKFFNILVQWDAYLMPELAAVLPLYTMKIFAVLEIIAGVLVLNRKTTRVGAGLVFAWLLAVTLQISLIGIYDIALRDLALALGALALIKLARAK